MADGDDPNIKRFVPYKTMFKLEERTVKEMEHNRVPRQLSCVNCKRLVPWDAYWGSKSRMDWKCHMCGMTAQTYWAKKTCREVTNGE